MVIKVGKILQYEFFGGKQNGSQMLITCKLGEIWWPSFFHVNAIGISPDDTAHVTCARPPSCKFFGNANGSITGGAAWKKFKEETTNKSF